MNKLFYWAIGLFEGEGCIGIRQDLVRPTNTRPYKYIRLQLDTTDKDVIDLFWNVVKVGKVYGGAKGYTTSGTNKPVWKWIVSGGKALTLINSFSPFLGKRRYKRLREVKKELKLL
jgi:hypothetical protein